MRVFPCALMMLGLAASGLAGQEPGPEPIVQVGVFSTNAEGRTTAAAFDTAPDLSSTVYVGRSLCQLGAGSRQPPSDAIGAWRFSARVISQTPDLAVIEVTWRRLIDNGVALAGADTAVQLTLLAGERAALDRAVPVSPGSCDAVDVAFEARYTPHAFRGAARRVFGAAGAARGAVVRMSGSGSAGAGGASGTSHRAFDVDLWLVHSVPGRDDRVLHQALPVTEAGAAFAFAPVTVETADGPASVQVTGTLALPRAERLVFSTARTIQLVQSSGPPRDQAAPRAGSRQIVEHVPGPEEVLAFEMPPVELKGGRTLPDRFSVRLRVTPR